MVLLSVLKKEDQLVEFVEVLKKIYENMKIVGFEITAIVSLII